MSGYMVRGRGGAVWLAAVALVAAVSGCATPKQAAFTDADWVSHCTTGRTSHERGDAVRAVAAYGRAAERARALDEADMLAIAVANRAACVVESGDALTEVMLAEAQADCRAALADARVSPARRGALQVAAARVEVARGEREAARALLEAVEGTPLTVATRARVCLLRAWMGPPEEIAVALSGLSEAEWAALSPVLQAERLLALASAAGDAAEAARLADAAAAEYRRAGRLAELAETLKLAGISAEAAGDAAGAFDRYCRAAASFQAQGLTAAAGAAAKRASDLLPGLDAAAAARWADLRIAPAGDDVQKGKKTRKEKAK